MADADHETAVLRVKTQVEHELLQRPGVHGVGIGHKEVDGQSTGTLAVVVSVEKKRAAGELAAGEMIPDEVDGVKFDVVEAGPFENAFRDVAAFESNRDSPRGPGNQDPGPSFLP